VARNKIARHEAVALLVESRIAIVVFVISTDAAACGRCAWEVDRTVDRKKRQLPIVWRHVEEAQVQYRRRH